MLIALSLVAMEHGLSRYERIKLDPPHIHFANALRVTQGDCCEVEAIAQLFGITHPR
ncbi:hypothetical protein [Paraburkholderia caribensis]|uniref:hypothetical protein n=1 Tax=Paraburkholderia caribensis TaxID=75105 RepID=UPI001CC70568|nr:hypothetical protein [Paraburkholderia caribensis]